MIIVMCQSDTGLCNKVIFTWIQQSEIKVCLKDRIRRIGAWLLLLVGVPAEIATVLALIHETNSEKWKRGKGRKSFLVNRVWVCVTLTFIMILEKRFQDSFLRELRLLRPVWLVQRRLIYVQCFCINRRTAGAERWSESGHLFYCCFFPVLMFVTAHSVKSSSVCFSSHPSVSSWSWTAGLHFIWIPVFIKCDFILIQNPQYNRFLNCEPAGY